MIQNHASTAECLKRRYGLDLFSATGGLSRLVLEEKIYIRTKSGCQSIHLVDS